MKRLCGFLGRTEVEKCVTGTHLHAIAGREPTHLTHASCCMAYERDAFLSADSFNLGNLYMPL